MSSRSAGVIDTRTGTVAAQQPDHHERKRDAITPPAAVVTNPRTGTVKKSSADAHREFSVTDLLGPFGHGHDMMFITPTPPIRERPARQ